MLDWKKHYLKFVAAAALNATVFVSYRLYVHKLKNKIDKLNSQGEELMNKIKVDLHPVLIKDFANYANLLEKFNFAESKDDLANMKIALFDYKGYTFALRKYDIHNRPEFTLLTETSKMMQNGVNAQVLCKEFMEKMKLTKVPVVWKNQFYEQFEEESKPKAKQKVKRRIRVKFEKEVENPED